MGVFSAHTAIEQMFAGNWTATPISWENARYRPSPNTTFIEFLIMPGASSQSLGADSPRYREYGHILITFWAPQGQGPGAVRQLIDTAIGVFRNNTVSDVTFWPAEPPEPVGDVEGWNVKALKIPYFRDEVL